MLEADIEVTNPKGIHARPSTMLAQTSIKFDSEIILELNGFSTDAKNIMGIISLGAFQGDVIHVTVNGHDEEKAMNEIKDIFALNFNDG